MSPVDSHSKNSGVINYACFNCYEHRTTRLQRSRTSERAVTSNAMFLLIQSKPSVNPDGEWKEGKMQQETMQAPWKRPCTYRGDTATFQKSLSFQK